MSVEEMQHSIFVASMGQIRIQTFRIHSAKTDDKNIIYHLRTKEFHIKSF